MVKYFKSGTKLSLFVANSVEILNRYVDGALKGGVGNVVKLLNVSLQCNHFTTEHAKNIYFIFLI